MDKLFTKEQAQVLTAEGFFKSYQQNRQTQTREKAYEAVEKLHMDVDVLGRRRYSDFSSFERQIPKQKAKAS